MTADLIIVVCGLIFADSIIFGSVLGIDTALLFTDKPRRALVFGASVIIIATLSDIITYPLYNYILSPASGAYDIAYLRTALFIAVSAGLTYGISIILKRFYTPLYGEIKGCTYYLYSNGAILGILITYSDRNIGYGMSVLYSFLSAVAALFAMILFADIRSRIASEKQPAAFRGVPSVLLAAGLAAMAFSCVILL